MSNDSDRSTLTSPSPEPPSVAAADAGVLDIGKERELRALRAQVSALNERIEKYEKRLVPNLTTIERHEEEHGYKCGFHLQVDVSMETASVVCRVCGAELAPLDVLREFARGERQFVQNLNHLREEKSQLAKEIDSLKKYRSSLRSQIRKKGGDVPDDPNCTRPSAKQYYQLVRELHRLAGENAELKKKVQG